MNSRYRCFLSTACAALFLFVASRSFDAFGDGTKGDPNKQFRVCVLDSQIDRQSRLKAELTKQPGILFFHSTNWQAWSWNLPVTSLGDLCHQYYRCDSLVVTTPVENLDLFELERLSCLKDCPGLSSVKEAFFFGYNVSTLKNRLNRLFKHVRHIHWNAIPTKSKDFAQDAITKVDQHIASKGNYAKYLLGEEARQAASKVERFKPPSTPQKDCSDEPSASRPRKTSDLFCDLHRGKSSQGNAIDFPKTIAEILDSRDSQAYLASVAGYLRETQPDLGTAAQKLQSNLRIKELILRSISSTPSYIEKRDLLSMAEKFKLVTESEKTDILMQIASSLTKPPITAWNKNILCNYEFRFQINLSRISIDPMAYSSTDGLDLVECILNWTRWDQNIQSNLVKAARSNNTELSDRAFKILKRLEPSGHKVGIELFDLMQSSNPRINQSAFDTFIAMHSFYVPEALYPTAIAHLKDARPRVREAALRALRQIHSLNNPWANPGDEKKIADLIHDPDENVQAAALRALRMPENTDAAFIDSIFAKMTDSKNSLPSPVQEAAADALARLNTEDMDIDAKLSALASGKYPEALRSVALQSLMHRGNHPERREIALSLLSDPSEMVQKQALTGLAFTRGLSPKDLKKISPWLQLKPPAPDTNKPFNEEDKRVDMAVLAAEAFGNNLHEHAALPFEIFPYLRSPSRRVRDAVYRHLARALEKLDANAKRELISKALRDWNTDEKLPILELLGSKHSYWWEPNYGNNLELGDKIMGDLVRTATSTNTAVAQAARELVAQRLRTRPQTPPTDLKAAKNYISKAMSSSLLNASGEESDMRMLSMLGILGTADERGYTRHNGVEYGEEISRHIVLAANSPNLKIAEAAQDLVANRLGEQYNEKENFETIKKAILEVRPSSDGLILKISKQFRKENKRNHAELIRIIGALNPKAPDVQIQIISMMEDTDPRIASAAQEIVRSMAITSESVKAKLNEAREKLKNRQLNNEPVPNYDDDVEP